MVFPPPASPTHGQFAQRLRQLLPRLATLLVVMLVFGITVEIDTAKRHRLEQEGRNQALAEANTLRAKLESAVNQKLILSRGLVAYVSTHPDISSAEFAPLARILIAQEIGIRAVQLARNSIISHIYPLAGNEAALGLDLLRSPENRNLAERSILSRRTVVGGPIHLVQGGQALIGRTPIFLPAANGVANGGAYWGFANVVMDVDKLFNSELVAETSGNFILGVRGRDAQGAAGAMIWGAPEAFDDNPVLLEIQLHDGSWQIGARAVDGWYPPPDKGLWLVGLIIAALAGAWVWQLTHTPIRLRATIQKATRDLQANERKFRTIAETVPSPILISVPPSGEIVYANQRLGDLVGKKGGDLVGQRIADFYTQQTPEASLMLDLLHQQEATCREIELTPTSGHRTCFTLHAQPTHFGGREAVIVTLQDITARKDAEENTAALAHTLEERVLERTQELAEQQQFWQALATAQSDVDEGVLVIENGRILFANDALARITGYGVAEITGGLSFSDLIHPDLREAVMAKHQRRLAGEKLETHYETLFQTKAGRSFTAEMAISLIARAPHPRVVILVRDIEQRKAAENALRARAAAIEAAGEMVVITDCKARVEHVNPAFSRQTGYSREECLGHPVASLLKSGIHPQEFYAKLWQTIMAGREWRGEVTNRRKDGSLFVAEQTIAPIFGPQGEITGFVSIKHDISERKALEARLEHLAHFDPLTGLPNRTLFFDRLGQALRHARRKREICALLFIDLDGFKAVNDHQGHEAGDAVLQEAGLRITGCIRESDTAARMGGDEFTVILSGLSDRADAERVAAKLIAALNTPFTTPTNVCHISASIGISLFPEHGEDGETLLSQADMAMYMAKRAGKNCHYLQQSSLVVA